MFCRIEVLKGDAKRVIYTHYHSGHEYEAIELAAERDRRDYGGDGFRVRDMHTGHVTESGATAS